MKDVLKINRDKNVFVTSDTHFGHNKSFIYEARGYNSVEEHTEKTIEKINTKVKKDDILFHLGDFSLNTSEEQFEKIISKIECQNIHCLFGNHPNPMKKIYRRQISEQFGREDINVTPIKYKNLIFLGNQIDCIIYGKYVVMNHFPLDIWDYMKDGSFMLTGHSHYNYPITP
jgi:calcineurin-like phosphoesterase family protein